MASTLPARRSQGSMLGLIVALVAMAVGFICGSIVSTGRTSSLTARARALSPVRAYKGFGELEGLLRENLTFADIEAEVHRIITSDEYLSWTPPKGILYLKTHKTGSSTVGSIFHRLASNHFLNCPVPPGSFSGTLWDFGIEYHRMVARKMPTNLGPNGGDRPYDIWSNHANYSPFLEEVVPSARGLVITSTRDPYTRQRSVCFFMKCCDSYTDLTTFERWLLTPGSLESLEERRHSQCSRNPVSKQTRGEGIEIGASEGRNTKLMLDKLRSKQWFSTISNRMDESILVLQDLFQLHPIDITYHSFKQVFHKKLEPSSLPKSAQKKALKRLKAWHDTDELMYQLADKNLDEELQRIFGSPEVLNETISTYRKLNVVVASLCGHLALTREYPKYAYPVVEEWCFFYRLDNQAWIDYYARINDEIDLQIHRATS